MKRFLFFLCSSIFMFLVILVIPVYAESEQEDLQKKISEYEDKLDSLKGQANTLSREIESANAQIGLAELNIQNAIYNISRKEKEIAALGEEIVDMEKRIDNLQNAIQKQKNLLGQRIRERYKNEPTGSFITMLFIDKFSSISDKDKYSKDTAENDKKLIEKNEKTKDAYNLQKRVFEETKAEEQQKKQELVQEKSRLDSLRVQLENKKAEKERLLSVTQNDEQKYQKLLEDAKKELNQMQGAVAVLNGTEGTPVEKGERIGTQGNTGFSKGDHLHFGVYRYSSFSDIDGWDWYYNNYVDPAKKLASKSVYWNDGCSGAGSRSTGKGDWNWPLDSPTISQGFGHTCWSNIYYGGKDHPAYDMYGAYGAAVYAVEDGEAYFCKNCLGDGANGVFIFHENNYMTIYWHLR